MNLTPWRPRFKPWRASRMSATSLQPDDGRNAEIEAPMQRCGGTSPALGRGMGLISAVDTQMEAPASSWSRDGPSIWTRTPRSDRESTTASKRLSVLPHRTDTRSPAENDPAEAARAAASAVASDGSGSADMYRTACRRASRRLWTDQSLFSGGACI